MLNRKYVLMTAVAGMTMLSTAIPAAAAAPVSVEEIKGKGVYVMVGQSSICEIPGFPNLPNINLPDQIKPWLPGTPGMPGTPENPESPELPGTPEIPELPGNPGSPDQPEKPSNPDQPELPENPENPETPDKPETPELPDNETDTEASSFAMQVIKLVNAERAKEGLPALKYDADIAKAALVRAKETEVSFSHTRPNGSSFSTALTENGVSFRGSGENIAWGQKSPEEVMKGWMNSPGHRANIMNKNFTKIGVGHYQNSKGVNYWTQLFTY